MLGLESPLGAELGSQEDVGLRFSIGVGAEITVGFRAGDDGWDYSWVKSWDLVGTALGPPMGAGLGLQEMLC